MNSEFNDLEQLFSEKLYNHEVTPPEHVWANIQKQKRAKLLLYSAKVAALILVVGLVSFIAYFRPLQSPTTSMSSMSNSSSKQKINPLNETHANDVGEDKRTIASNNSETKTSEVDLNLITKIKTAQKRKITKHAKFIPLAPVSKIENLEYDTKDMEILMNQKNNISLDYKIYPSLSPYVFAPLKNSKKYTSSDKDENHSKQIHTYSFEIGVGPNYVSRHLKGNNIQLRNESESPLFSIQTGFKFNYHFNQKWQVQCGLGLENRAEQINYKATEIEDITSVTKRQVTVLHPILPPQIITISDTVITPQTTENVFKTNNKYTTISLPVIFGYNFNMGKLQYRISAGTLFNIYSINKAYNLTKVSDKIELTPYQESKNITPSLVGSVGLYYPINLNYQVFAELAHFQNMTNRLPKETGQSQKNSGSNVLIGLKINFKKQ